MVRSLLLTPKTTLSLADIHSFYYLRLRVFYFIDDAEVVLKQ